MYYCKGHFFYIMYLFQEILDTFEELQPYLVKAGPDLSNASSITIYRKEKPDRRKSAKHKHRGEITLVASPKNKGNNPRVDLPGKDLADEHHHITANKHDLSVDKHKSSVQKNKKSDQQEIPDQPNEKRVTMLSLISKLYKLTGEAKVGCEN